MNVEQLKFCALDSGADLVGVTSPAKLTGEEEKFRRWLSLNYCGDMAWMQNNIDIRHDPEKLLPGCKSIIVIAVNYYVPQLHFNFPNFPKISRYAWGRDYHKVLGEILGRLQKSIVESVENSGGEKPLFKIAVDSAPFRDKIWAMRAGLGWIGKNSILITRKFGSWIFIGSLLTTYKIEGEYDMQHPDHCGKCRLCIDRCPTSAIMQGRHIDARSCISYLTMEHDGDFPKHHKDSLNGWVYGCDMCQDVCPWNNFARPTRHHDFHPREGLVVPDLRELSKLTEDEFDRLTAGTPIRRVGREKLRRNALAVMGLL
ncbi:MAG: tRNA epoxyqueuosine(34) reductase QueG [bacterium]|nr:tRNA epoxyqueuosine(34) reductase QueG [bacterium]